MTTKEPSSPIERKTLHKERMFTTTHHYFFDVKEASNGSKYIVIDQRRKVGEVYEGVKMRIFEDELLEFQRVLQKVIRIALSEEETILTVSNDKPREPGNIETEFTPPFFNKLMSTGDWKEFERYTHYLLKLIGVQSVYSFIDDRQAGRADGFFLFGNIAVMYDCTLSAHDIEENKREQIINYCNRLRQGTIELPGGTTEEFHNHQKQVWIITRRTSRRIRLINGIAVKEVSISDLINLYQDRLQGRMVDENLETKLRNISERDL